MTELGRQPGLAEAELKEMIIHLAFYAGWHRTGLARRHHPPGQSRSARLDGREQASDVTVVTGAGQTGQAIARRVSAGKHVLLADLRQDNADTAAQAGAG